MAGAGNVISGNVIGIDMELVVPDAAKTIRDGAIAPWNSPAYAHELEEILALADDYDFIRGDLSHTPIRVIAIASQSPSRNPAIFLGHRPARIQHGE